MIEENDDIDSNLARARELATQRYVCPVCDGGGCASCDDTGEVSKDEGNKLLEHIYGKGLGVLKLVGQAEAEHTVNAIPLGKWQTWNSLAVLLGTSLSVPPEPLDDFHGAEIECMELDDLSGVEHKELRVPKGTKRVYRVANADEHAARLAASRPTSTDWMTAAELARQRGVSAAALYGGTYNDFRIELRTATEEDLQRLGLDRRTKRLMRAVSETGEIWATASPAEPPEPEPTPEPTPPRTEVRLKPDAESVELRAARKERDQFKRDLVKVIAKRDELQKELKSRENATDLRDREGIGELRSASYVMSQPVLLTGEQFLELWDHITEFEGQAAELQRQLSEAQEAVRDADEADTHRAEDARDLQELRRWCEEAQQIAEEAGVRNIGIDPRQAPQDLVRDLCAQLEGYYDGFGDRNAGELYDDGFSDGSIAALRPALRVLWDIADNTVPATRASAVALDWLRKHHFGGGH